MAQKIVLLSKNQILQLSKGHKILVWRSKECMLLGSKASATIDKIAIAKRNRIKKLKQEIEELESRKYGCNRCDYESKSKAGLMKHVQWKHEGKVSPIVKWREEKKAEAHAKSSV